MHRFCNLSQTTAQRTLAQTTENTSGADLAMFSSPVIIGGCGIFACRASAPRDRPLWSPRRVATPPLLVLGVFVDFAS